MFKLEYCFECLNGKYFLTAEGKDIVAFSIDSDIAELESKEGSLNEADSKRFFDLLKESQIERWDQEYKADQSSIEDAVKWSVHLICDDREYSSKGEESYEPYNYNKLVEALMICDEKASYFRIGEGND